MSDDLKKFRDNLAKATGLTPEQLKRFDEASNHPYECKCKICKEWWELVGPEKDE